MIRNIIFIILFAVVTIFPQVKKTAASDLAGYKTFTATAYCLRGKTASGAPAGPGIIATDRRVIKLGSKVIIAGLGQFIALDTGGAIRGNRIDIWMGCSQAKRFGRRTVRLRVL